MPFFERPHSSRSGTRAERHYVQPTRKNDSKLRRYVGKIFGKVSIFGQRHPINVFLSLLAIAIASLVTMVQILVLQSLAVREKPKWWQLQVEVNTWPSYLYCIVGVIHTLPLARGMAYYCTRYDACVTLPLGFLLATFLGVVIDTTVPGAWAAVRFYKFSESTYGLFLFLFAEVIAADVTLRSFC